MSEKAKATPTPWRAEYDPPEVMMGGHKREWKVLGQLEGFGTAQYVASCFHFPQSQANTELIVAAVNSHEAALELADAVLKMEHDPEKLCDEDGGDYRNHLVDATYNHIFDERCLACQLHFLARKFLALTDGKEER